MVAQSMESVIHQLNDDMLFIVVDDGSSDNTLIELQKFSSCKNLVVLSQENKGFVKTMVDIISRYESDYIAVHGSGDISLPNRFKKQSEFLDINGDTVCVGCRIKNNYYNQDVKIVGEVFNCCFKKKIIKTNPYSHGEVMFRKSAYESVGGYDTFFKYGQDRDLWCKLSHLGKFSGIEDVLYERFVGVKNSVSGDLNQKVLQRYFSHYAVFRHKLSLCEPHDVIGFEGFKEHQVLLFDKKYLIDELKMSFLSYLITGNYSVSKFYLDSYVYERGNTLSSYFYKSIFCLFSRFKIKLR